MQSNAGAGDRPIDILRMEPAANPTPDFHYVHGAGAPSDLRFMQLINILRCRRKSIICITLIGTLLACAVALLVPRKYTATAQIMVDPQQADAVGTLAGGARLPDEAAIDTQVSMLGSRDHLERVIDSFSKGSAADQSTHGRKLPDGLPVGIVRDVDELARHQLKVMQERRSRVISINFTATSPQSAATMANRIADLHIAKTVEAKRSEIRQELARLETRADRLKADMAQSAELLRKTLQQPPGSADEPHLGDLKREAAATGQAYAAVLRREQELRQQEESITPEAHVLSRAAPPDRPSSLSPLLFIFPAFLVSLICGSWLAVFRERLDRGLRSERDVAEALGIPCIGLVPQLPLASTHAHHCILEEPFAPYTEAIRSSVAALQLATPDRRPMTVLISSSVPGEGKTTLAVSLAVYAAHLSKRTLLIDFDFRHPSSLRGKHANDDVSDLQGSPAALIRHLPELDIDYLPIPRSSSDPLAIFAGPQLQAFLRQLHDSYDCVFIDSPPLLGITEARLLRTVADKVLFIVKWGSTRREVAQNALNLLRNPLVSGDGRVGETSAVITQVDLRRHARYRYGDTAETFVKFKNYYFKSAAR